MTLWGAILLGLVEGLTEFLPVSSTGHLILVGSALGFTGPQAVGFEIAIQMGAILSVVVYYRHRLRELLLGLRRDAGNRRLAFSLGLAFLPAAVIGLATHRWIESHLFGAFTVAWALLLGGIMILVIEYRLRQSRITHLEAIGLREAWWVGVAQCLSLVPGVSRSGATIMGGLLVARTARASGKPARPTSPGERRCKVCRGRTTRAPSAYVTDLREWPARSPGRRDVSRGVSD